MRALEHVSDFGSRDVDPHEVLQAKERIATVHACGSRSTVQREAEFTATRVIRPAEVVSIDRHWQTEVNRLFSAHSGGAR